MAGLSGLLPISAHAALPGAELSLCWAIPFAGILLSIALGPLLFAHFWHKNYGKVALMWAVLAAVPLFMFFGTQTSIEALAHALIGDYVPFIIFVGSLYIVAGGIHLRGSFVGKPWLNTTFLLSGAILANLMGTTGAAMLLIRPLLSANRRRHYQMHTYIFFIFIVANIAGSLTPLGDPPLFLGFLRGVTFFWTAAHLWEVTGLAVGLLLIIYFLLDTWLYKKELKDNEELKKPVAYVPFGFEGSINFVLLACIVGAVLMSGFWKTGVEYLAFFNLAGGDPAYLMTTGAHTLMAISMGAVFMGAMTYIGNAPNFMVVSIVQNRGVKMPSFFGFMAWSYGVLVPIFLVLTWLFLM